MAADSPRVRLVVLYGGVSAEHDVSCMSATHVLSSADPERYDVVPIGITTEGVWTSPEVTTRALAEDRRELPASLPTDGAEVEPLPTVTAGPDDPPVVVFPLLHGPMGEDGTVQGLLELADVAYVGSGVLGSAVCMDKALAKVVLGAAGLPQPRWLAARDVDVGEVFARRVADELGFPAFVKPSNLGSSVGVAKVADPAGLDAAVTAALALDEWVVVEEAVAGRELEVGVLGNADPRATVPGEIRPSAEFYDYDDKYSGAGAELVIPADVPADVAARAGELAVAAYRALRCDGLARCDFFYEADGRGLLVNEVNTMPGFTPFSMYPALWAASGVPYDELIDELVRLALERHEHRRGLGRGR